MYGADGYNQWKSLGICSIMFISSLIISLNESIPRFSSEDACQKALTYDMHMEPEFYDNALNRGKAYRLKNYMSAFRNMAYGRRKRLAYYQGGASLLTLKKIRERSRIPNPPIMSSVILVIGRPIRSSH